MLLLTIALSILMLVAAHAAGLTETWLGTGSATAVIVMLVITGYTPAHFLFDGAAGWLLTIALWIFATSLNHHLLAEFRSAIKPITPIRPIGRNRPTRHALAWQLAGYRLAFAWEVA